MIPLVSIPDELVMTLRLIRRVNQEVSSRTGMIIPFKIGTMVETPRAALLADRLAQWAEFLSFGTNDLTQLTYGFSRDDVERRMLGTYLEKGLMTASPFAELDDDGVATLMAYAVEQGPRGAPGHQAGHLRRARRRPVVDRDLRAARSRLRVGVAQPHPGRAAGRGARPGGPPGNRDRIVTGKYLEDLASRSSPCSVRATVRETR